MFSKNSRSRFTSETNAPPYLLRHLKNVALHAVLPQQVCDWHAALGVLQDRNDLGLATGELTGRVGRKRSTFLVDLKPSQCKCYRNTVISVCSANGCATLRQPLSPKKPRAVTSRRSVATAALLIPAFAVAPRASQDSDALMSLALLNEELTQRQSHRMEIDRHVLRLAQNIHAKEAVGPIVSDGPREQVYLA